MYRLYVLLRRYCLRCVLGWVSENGRATNRRQGYPSPTSSDNSRVEIPVILPSQG